MIDTVGKRCYILPTMATVDATELRTGLKLLIDGQPYTVIERQFIKPGKGAAFTRTKMKNLLTGRNIESNIRSGEKIELADIEEKAMSFLYKEASDFVFMDQQSYEQITILADLVGDDWRWLKDNMVVHVLFWNGRAIGVTLPNFVELRVTSSEPGVKGDTSGGAQKPATLETGATINVPLFINENDLLRIDTRSGQYCERVKG
ncbi:MAG TPA: elongation factor P [Polyangia bacterium]|jgi:elongation factor P|nr:elongation factor P [Polyangia bacterium]